MFKFPHSLGRLRGFASRNCKRFRFKTETVELRSSVLSHGKPRAIKKCHVCIGNRLFGFTVRGPACGEKPDLTEAGNIGNERFLEVKVSDDSEPLPTQT